MIRLGLTQRVTVVDSYGERRDCLDQAWTGLLEDWGYQPIPLPNTVEEPEAYLDSLDLDGLVLTSGNDLATLNDPDQPAPERDRFERAAIDWGVDAGVPICGICRGLELLNDHFGGELSPVSDHVATAHTVSFTQQSISLAGTKLDLPATVETNSYHDYGIEPADIASPLHVLATAPDGTVEALAHDQAPICGIMWHPERETASTAIDRKLFEALFGGSEQ